METLNYMVLILKDMEEQLLNKKDFTNEVAKRCMVTPYVVDEIFNISSGVIIENLLKNNNDNMYYPEKVDSEGEFWCCGHQFIMKKIRIGGEQE